MQDNHKCHKWSISDHNFSTSQNLQISREYSSSFCIERECCLTWRLDAWLMSRSHSSIAEPTSIDRESTQTQSSSNLADYFEILHTWISILWAWHELSIEKCDYVRLLTYQMKFEQDRVVYLDFIRTRRDSSTVQFECQVPYIKSAACIQSCYVFPYKIAMYQKNQRLFRNIRLKVDTDKNFEMLFFNTLFKA